MSLSRKEGFGDCFFVGVGDGDVHANDFMMMMMKC